MKIGNKVNTELFQKKKDNYRDQDKMTDQIVNFAI